MIVDRIVAVCDGCNTEEVVQKKEVPPPGWKVLRVVQPSVNAPFALLVCDSCFTDSPEWLKATYFDVK